MMLPLVCVHGPSGGHKTRIVRDVIAATRAPHIYVNCVHYAHARALYGEIAWSWLKQLPDHPIFPGDYH